MLRVTRTHTVGAQESIEVPAGTFRAWRVDYEERQAFGPRSTRAPGTLWIASRIGLVKSRASDGHGVVQTMELLATSDD
jgi:hypothetical protein